MLLVPTLSQADPRESLEGSIDPLGTYAIADRMAVRLVPGIRERQKHPRYLTAIAVSLSLCSEFEDDAIAADNISEPWQVFEWLVVEGLVRTADTDALRGLPGRDKASAAIAARVPLSMTRYLKTPAVFGFHGIYRALARSLKIELTGRLGENGAELLSVWQKEQGLEGFTGSIQGRGAVIRRQLVEAIHHSLEAGAVARKAGWAGFGFFSSHLGIYSAGDAEARMLKTLLLDRDGDAQFRHETLSALLTPSGRELWREECESERYSERRFHNYLTQVASPELKILLAAISAYERFSRLLQDAFDDILRYLARYQKRIQPSELASLEGVRLASEQVPALFREVAEQLAPVSESVAFNKTFGELAEPATSLEWSRRLLDHHCKIQRKKPPQGRAPWIDRFDDGSTMIRTQYLRNYQPRLDDEYVNAYRTNSLWSFARDLRWAS